MKKITIEESYAISTQRGISYERDLINKTKDNFNKIISNENLIDNLLTNTENLKKEQEDSSKKLEHAKRQKTAYEYSINNLPKQNKDDEKKLEITKQNYLKLQKLDKLASITKDIEQNTNILVLLKQACKQHDSQKFNFLISNLKNINQQDVNQKTSLMYVVEHNFIYGLQQLLKYNIDAELTDSRGNNAFHQAILLNQNHIIDELVKYNDQLINCSNGEGKLPLYLMLEQKDLDNAKKFYTESQAGQCLNSSVMFNNLDVAKILLKIQPSLVKFYDVFNRTALSLSLEKNLHQFTNMLMQNGANLKQALNNKALKFLDLSSIKLDQNNAAVICDYFKGSASITYLDISNTQLSIEWTANILQSISYNLRCINFSSNNLGYQGAKIIANSLTSKYFIKILDLSNNYFDEAGGIFIASLLGLNKFITDINLANNNIGDAGAIFIANGLNNNKCLTSINLSGNNIGAKGYEAFANLIVSHCSLISLDLSQNRNIDIEIKYFKYAVSINQSLLSFKGFDDKEGQISQKIITNQQKFKKILNDLIHHKKLPKDENSYKEKEIFIIFKQLQSDPKQLLKFENQDLSKNQCISLMYGLLKDSEYNNNHDDYITDLLAQMKFEIEF